MKKRHFLTTLAAGAAVLVLTGCATNISTQTDYDRSVSFDQYQKFAWISDSPLAVPPKIAASISPFTEKRIQQAIQSELTGRGYVFVSDREAADLTVAFSIGARRELSVDSYPVAYRSGWPWAPAIVGNEVSVENSTEGSLAIDFFDRRTKQPIWHGIAKKKLSTADENLTTSIIQDSVREVLKPFPPTADSRP